MCVCVCHLSSHHETCALLLICNNVQSWSHGVFHNYLQQSLVKMSWVFKSVFLILLLRISCKLAYIITKSISHPSLLQYLKAFRSKMYREGMSESRCYKVIYVAEIDEQADKCGLTNIGSYLIIITLMYSHY